MIIYQAAITTFFGIPNKMLQRQFVKCFALINMRKQAEVLTGVKDTSSSCLITPFYF